MTQTGSSHLRIEDDNSVESCDEVSDVPDPHSGVLLCNICTSIHGVLLCNMCTSIQLLYVLLLSWVLCRPFSTPLYQ